MARDVTEVTDAYRKRASRYDFTVSLFDLFRPVGFDLAGWRRAAVRALHLQRGATVVDVGCGTGLNFPLLQPLIGPQGTIIGVDISAPMLDEARRRAADRGWRNVRLECADAAAFAFPPDLGGVLSTFALTLIPGCDHVIAHACRALAPGRRLSVLDMAWPPGLPEWWRHVLFFLRSYGVTGEVIRRRPWETVWAAMQRHLQDVTRKRLWMGFFYLAAGTRKTA